ncbi:MAG TPA: helix-turn-helix transcriptional regulator [Chloroflexi bacterium]|jgi:transcriptional regulator with XRE-family HTH domain|nr:helix-turn-helix transcriptional regulator [Chloroflexota bacterium]
MRDREIQILVQALDRIRQRENSTVAGMARRLGFSAGHLSMIFTGKRRPGIRFVRAVCERYPEIRRRLARSLDEAGDRRISS